MKGTFSSARKKNGHPYPSPLNPFAGLRCHGASEALLTDSTTSTWLEEEGLVFKEYHYFLLRKGFYPCFNPFVSQWVIKVSEPVPFFFRTPEVNRRPAANACTPRESGRIRYRGQTQREKVRESPRD